MAGQGRGEGEPECRAIQPGDVHFPLLAWAVHCSPTLIGRQTYTGREDETHHCKLTQQNVSRLVG